MTFEERIDWFSARNLIMLFLLKDRFLNPLVPVQLQKLKSSGLLDNKYLLKVILVYILLYIIFYLLSTFFWQNNL